MSDTDAEQFSLRWNNFHSNLSSGFHALLQGEDLVDVTLAAGGNFVQAHKIVLSVCSPYFKELFKVNPCKHPIVIMKDVGHKELISILEFMYLGEVNVRQEELSSFLKTAETLQVKGLTGDDSPAPLASHPQRKQTVTRKHSSVLEPLVVHSEESPTRPIKRARVGAPPPTSSPFTSSPHNSPALRLMPSSPACSENLRDNEVVLTKPKQEPIKEVGLTRPKQEPIEYDSDIEEVTLDEKMLRGHDPLMNVSLDQTLQRGDEHPLMSLLGGGSSQQQDPMAALPLFGISHDSGGSQDSGQGDPIPSKQNDCSKVSNYQCEVCQKLFTRKDHLRTHEKNLHGEDAGPFACIICSQIYKNVDSLRKHIAKFHVAKLKTENEKYICNS